MESPGRKVQIQLLGTFSVQVDGTTVDPRQWRLRKARALVAMIALAPGQRRHREQVLERLWPDVQPVSAARNLHQALYVARLAIAGPGNPTGGLLAIRGDQVVLDEAGGVEVDVLQFEQAANAALDSGAPDSDREPMLRAATELYGGDLPTELLNADWLTARRDKLQHLHSSVLIALATSVAQRAPDEGLAIVGRVLAADPLHESAVRVQMKLLARTGRRSEALARFERLTDDLLDAFGTDPDSQTQLVFRELLTGGAPDSRRRAAESTEPDDSSVAVGRLPRPLTSFVGRERELADVERVMGRGRLVTLTGAGGSGKTRMALEAARRVRGTYPDGVWFVDLVAVGESLLVADAVSETLGLEPGTGPSRAQALVGQLDGRHALLVLDNCEHVLAACAHMVGAVLAGCPKMHVLATSREPLHVTGEFTLRVPSLALPPPNSAVGLDLVALGRSASVQLLVERAQQVRPDFVLDSANARDVVDICRRLDGMPLALELAAARMAHLEPAEIVQRLGNALAVLGRGPVGATRHQTLRATLEWSHALLNESERILLRRLSVFAGSTTLDAVENVCAAAPLSPAELLDVLGQLVDKSLVVTERAAGRSRYRQLETVRQFAREKLEQAGETRELSAAHCRYFLSVARSYDPERSKGVIIEQPRSLDGEHDNLRAALRWSCAEDPSGAIELVAALWRFWFLRGHSVEGARWVERALAAAPAPSLARARALIGLTGLDSRQGRNDRHLALGGEALRVARQIGHPTDVLRYHLLLATLAWSTTDLDEAQRIAQALRAEATELGQQEVVAATTWILGQCALSRDDGPDAADRFEACLIELADADPRSAPFFPVVTTSMHLIPVLGRLVPALEETLLLGRRVGVRQATGYVLSALGDAARSDGRPQSAVAVIARSIEHFRELGDDLARAQAQNQLGCVYRDAGDFDRAETSFAVARDLRSVLGDRRGELLTKINAALLRAAQGELTVALADARDCLSMFEAVGDQVGIGAAFSALGAIELTTGENRAAREMYELAAERLSPWERIAPWQRLMVAELSLELGDRSRAEREARQAAAVFHRMGSVPGQQRLAALNKSLATC